MYNYVTYAPHNCHHTTDKECGFVVFCSSIKHCVQSPESHRIFSCQTVKNSTVVVLYKICREIRRLCSNNCSNGQWHDQKHMMVRFSSLTAKKTHYTLWVKKHPWRYSFITLPNVGRFSKVFFAIGFSRKFAIRPLSCFPSYLKYVATLFCEIYVMNFPQADLLLHFRSKFVIHWIQISVLGPQPNKTNVHVSDSEGWSGRHWWMWRLQCALSDLIHRFAGRERTRSRPRTWLAVTVKSEAIYCSMDVNFCYNCNGNMIKVVF